MSQIYIVKVKNENENNKESQPWEKKEILQVMRISETSMPKYWKKEGAQTKQDSWLSLRPLRVYSVSRSFYMNYTVLTFFTMDFRVSIFL